MNMLSFVVPEEQEKARENVAASMAGKNPGINEYTLLRKNGSTFPALVRTNAIISETKVKGIRGIVLEITERKQMEKKLEQYSKHLEELIETRTIELKKTQQQLVKSERFAAIGELAGIIAHDLRHPLTDIKNALHFLRENGESLSEVQSQLLETIYESTIQSNRIINDLLDYSKEIHLDLKENSPRALILDALDFINIPERVKILNNVSDTPYIIVDSDRITRVFKNLIKNGI
jgi:two-component system, LuxR family, sensor kinase FixL